ncbi:RNA polymerase sigma factor [Deminuibacter soli]|uniref:RNA polymerase sigma factor SigS n=1 Tax=Deminuibacter soli TaxID=2291815 RepID=A0A3E1ND09_9BACT|nr:sigma-70 family RNA polymerase sigma factor [Deminuibacter soli]RFM25717.1 hypothetical protein DXN05_23695 [Deminuibacter soli]
MNSNSISALRDGCESTFEEAYYAFHQKLYAYFVKKTGSVTVSEELVQVTFIKLWQFRSGLNTELPLSVQLFRIAKTSVIDILRKEARNRVVAAIDEEAHNIPVNAADELVHDRLLLVKQGMRHLSPMRRKIIESRLEGLSNHEIAVSLSVSKKTVENQINKAVRDIRKNMDVPLIVISVTLHLL